MGAAETTGQLKWPKGLEWPVHSAWQAQMLAKVVLGVETTGIETDKQAHRIAKKLHAHNLSYSPTTVPSYLRNENFALQRERALAAGGALLALTEKESRIAFTRLQDRLSADREDFDPTYDIGLRDSGVLLTTVMPLVEQVLREEVAVTEVRQPEPIAA